MGIPLFFIFTTVNKQIISLLFFASLGMFGLISYNSTSSFDWIYESYGFLLQVTDLTPNIGLFWILLTFITTLKPYPSVADLAIQFGLLPLFYPIISEFLVRFIGIAQIYLYSFILMPIAWYAWLYQGSANANFFYGTTLAIGCAQIWLLVEILHLGLERQYKRKHGIIPFGTVEPKHT